MMGIYKTKTTVTDFGPYVTELLVNVGKNVSAKDVAPEDFSVYVTRKDKATGEVIKTKEFFQWDEEPKPARGIRKVISVSPCDSEGKACDLGKWAALKMGLDALGKTIAGQSFSENDYQVTYLKPSGILNEGYEFGEYSGNLCPQLEGWKNSQSSSGEYRLNYGYYTPSLARETANVTENVTENVTAKKLPLVIWLHGAGEGGHEPEIAYTGNKAVHLSSEEIQEKLGGQAWVLAPQCPSVWMDDGKEQLGRSNKSIYTTSLKACIDEFIKDHEVFIDKSRIFLGGCSNGGFMTVRMAIDYPGFFAALFPVCEAFFEENITPWVISRLKDTPCWFVHAKGDGLVKPTETVLPLYEQLLAAGASDVHFTYIDSMDGELSQFWPGEMLPPGLFDHGVWVKVYNDECKEDFHGGPVLINNRPVTLFEWLYCHCL